MEVGEVGKVRGYGGVGRWEVPSFVKGGGTESESKISSFCF